MRDRLLRRFLVDLLKLDSPTRAVRDLSLSCQSLLLQKRTINGNSSFGTFCNGDSN